MADGCGTNIFVGTRNEYLVRVIPRDNESINECWISDRDRFGLEYADHEARLTFPLVRRDGVLSPATWDEALQLVADKLKSTPKEKIAAIGGPKLTNEGALAMARLFHEVVGTPNVDHEWQPTLSTPGSPSASFYEELEGADVILIVGSNPNEELPILDLRLKKAAFQRKANVIVVNSSKTSLDDLAKQVVRPNPGSDAAIVNALAKLVHQSWHDEPEKTEMLRQLAEEYGARDWLNSLTPYASGSVAQAAGVDESTLRGAADAISNSQRLFLLLGANAGGEVLAALQNLASLKNRGDYLVVLQPEANAAGVRRAGLVPGDEGLSGQQVIEAAARGEIEVLFLAATNPLNGARDYEVARKALDATPFVVAQTLFENDVTYEADVVLPAASFLEQDGTTTNFHGRVQKLKQVFKPRERRDEDGSTLSACAPDWMIFTKLGLLLGADWHIASVNDWTTQNRLLSPALPSERRFTAASGQVSAPSAGADNTLQLFAGSYQYDGGESFQYSSQLNLVVPDPFVKLHRADARKIGIENKALVEITTSRGTARVRANVGRDVKQGTAWIPQRLRDVRSNALLDPNAGITLITITKLADAPKEELAPVVVTV